MNESILQEHIQAAFVAGALQPRRSCEDGNYFTGFLLRTFFRPVTRQKYSILN